MAIENARIESTMLGYEDHGILTAMLYVKMETGSQGFGGRCLDTPHPNRGKGLRRIGTAYGMETIARILQTVGVDKWEQLTGKHIRVDKDDWSGPIKRIGHIIEDRWLDPEELLAEMKTAQ